MTKDTSSTPNINLSAAAKGVKNAVANRIAPSDEEVSNGSGSNISSVVDFKMRHPRHHKPINHLVYERKFRCIVCKKLFNESSVCHFFTDAVCSIECWKLKNDQ